MPLAPGGQRHAEGRFVGAPFRPHCLSIDLRRLHLRPQSKPCVCGGGVSLALTRCIPKLSTFS